MWSVWMQLRFGANLPLRIYTRMCVWTTCWLMHVHRCAWENSESHTEGCIYRFKERGWRVSEGNKFRDQNRPMEGRLNAAWKRKAGTTWSKVDWARMKGETAPDWKAVRACWLQLARLLEGSVSAENRKIRLCFYYCSRRCPCTTATPPPTLLMMSIIFLSHQVTVPDFMSHGEGTLLLLKIAVVAPSCNVSGQDCCQHHSAPPRHHQSGAHLWLGTTMSAHIYTISDLGNPHWFH